MKKIYLLGLLLFFFRTATFSQRTTPSDMQWKYFDKTKVTHNNIFSSENGFSFRSDDGMKLIQAEKDELGFTHHRFQQTYKGIPVEGAEYIIHERDGGVEKANGVYIENISMETTPIFSVQEAIQKALNFTNAKQYMWEDEIREQNLKEILNDNTATYYPKGELIIIQNDMKKEYQKENLLLAYKFDVFSKEPFERNFVYINARTGELIRKISRIQECSNGTAATLFNGTQTITTKYRSATNDYILYDECRGGGIHTREYSTYAEISDTNNTWASSQANGTSAQWVTEMTYDYYLATFNRNSFNNIGTIIHSYINSNGYGKDNAFWDGSSIHFGSGNGGKTNNPLVSLDVAGHEFTHGVTQNTAGLAYWYESGALNESFSDIFGTMVEFYGQGGVGDYFIAEDMWVSGKLRDLSNPNSRGQPDTYGGTYWYTSGSGGVHTNSGVQNYWFYLLAEGGIGTNDNGTPYTVTGIGKNAAAAISYRNLTVYLTSNSQYYDAYLGAVSSAEDLYGVNSNEVTQTRNAWRAVGIGGQSCNANIIQSDTTISSGQLLTLKNADTISVGSPNVFTILSGGNVIIRASAVIYFNPGTSIDSGVVLSALISSCDGQGQNIVSGTDENNFMFVKREQEEKAKIVEKQIPKEYSLSQAYPNPFNPITKIKYNLPEAAFVILKIYNILGQEVATLVNEQKPIGYYSIEWNASSLPSGMYIYRITTGKFSESKKMQLVK